MESHEASQIHSPRLVLGTFTAPAYLLPCLLAFCWVVSKIYQRRASVRQRTSKSTDKSPALKGSYSAPSAHMPAVRGTGNAWQSVCLSIIALLVPVILGFVIVAYCSSCLGWRWALLRQPPSPPALDGASVFPAVLYLLVWSFTGHSRGDQLQASQSPLRTLARETSYCADIVGASVMGLLVAFTLVPLWNGFLTLVLSVLEK